jgi:hypothetical protein
LNGALNPADKWQMLVKDETGQDIYKLEFRTKEFQSAIRGLCFVYSAFHGFARICRRPAAVADGVLRT